ncbi:signal peptide peptidase SppA [Myxacorys almedinensis]|uniref:Protease 4 n=1 Tax=Myxacorys almedinensis A TaxID=2690445 RepID=A0A8J7Z8G3_9CYAN|nr:signal peptide peptidase SppA [Myxacorys almedinensis]NDJ19973.1 signal peptide peptidase SppA [Myxacorys almedinensis A]
MRDFLKHTLATVLGLFIFMGISIGSLLMLVIVASVSSRDASPTVKDRSILVFDVSETITDAPSSASPREVLSGALAGSDRSTIALRSVLNTIDAAAKDKRITGLYLYDGEGSSTSGLATLREVRKALEQFKATGKKIYAYGVDWKEREYYLASIADQIAVNPIGNLEINGFNAEAVFFAEALQNYGVGVQVTRVGKYKSAVEPFLRSSRSPADRQQTQQWLNDLWGEFVATTSKSRNLKPAQLQQIVDSAGFLTATEARDRKLVDRVLYADEMSAQLKTLTGNDEESKSFRQVSLKNYARVAEDKATRQNSQNQVAIVYVDGQIVNGQGTAGNAGGDRIARQLRDLRLDDDVKAIVLRVNSPGGSATASDVIQREAILARKAKPLVVSMGNLAASGGYWIATYSDRIYAEPNTITGSIGVFGQVLNVQKLANQNGITWDTVKTGRFADAQTLSRPKTPEELKLIQRSVDKIYDQFLSKVSESRKLDKAKVAEIAQGRVWSGGMAKSLGLVDELGGLDEAIRDAANRAKLGDDWQVEEYPKSRTFEERLLERLVGASLGIAAPKPDDLLTQGIETVQQQLEALRSMNDPQHIYLQLPVNFQIR